MASMWEKTVFVVCAVMLVLGLSGCTTQEEAFENVGSLPYLSAEQKSMLLVPSDLNPLSDSGWVDRGEDYTGLDPVVLDPFACGYPIEETEFYAQAEERAMEASGFGPVLFQQLRLVKREPGKKLIKNVADAVEKCAGESSVVMDAYPNVVSEYEVYEGISEVSDSVAWKQTVVRQGGSGEETLFNYIALILKDDVLVCVIVYGHKEFVTDEVAWGVLDEAVRTIASR